MFADADLAAVAELIGDRTRASFLLSLLEGRPLPASELAARARVSPSLASAHLRRLLDGGLVDAQRHGRQRLYQLTNPQIAQAIEALITIAPARQPRSLREANQGHALQRARTCYDHLAGSLGVGLTDALAHQGILDTTDCGYHLTPEGRQRLQDFGIDLDALDHKHRPLTRQCLDWTERRHHLAGSLGAALADRLFSQRWLLRTSSNRAVRITNAGSEGLQRAFGLELPA